MRLIDTYKLKEIIDGSEEFIDWQKDEIKSCIDACDTEYDINKVVDQLKEESCIIDNDAGNRAVEIIEAGGVDG